MRKRMQQRFAAGMILLFCMILGTVAWAKVSQAAPATPTAAAEGAYLLKALHSGKCLEVLGAALSNGSKVQQATCNTAALHQQWVLTAVGNGIYKVLNRNSGKALDVTWSGLTDGTAIWQWDYISGNNQKWKVVPQSDGSYQLFAVHSNKCADVTGASTADGVALQQATCTTNNNQRFTLVPIPLPAEGAYTLTARHSGKCLQVTSAGLANGDKVQQWSCNAATLAQQWYLAPIGDGYYKLVNRNSGKVLDVAWSGLTDSTTIWQWDYISGNNQKWKAIAQSDGSYQLQVVHSNKCAAISGAATTDGAFLVQMTCGTGAEQRFTLTPAVMPTDGIYRLKARHSGQCMEVAGASSKTGGNVQQGVCDPTARHQQWQLAAVGDGYYRLINLNSGQMLEVTAGLLTDGGNIDQWDYLAVTYQQWQAIAQSDGSYQFMAAHSRKCIDVAGSSTTAGANIQQATCTTNANQRFTLEPVELLALGIYNIKAVHSNKCVTVAGASLTAGSQVQQNSCDSAQKQQQWQLVALGGGYYKLLNVNSGKVLAVPGLSPDNLIPLQQDDDSDIKSQRWRIVAQGSAYLLMAGHNNNKCATVYASLQTDNTPLVQNDCNLSNNQRYYFLPVTPPAEAVYALKALHSSKCMAVAGASLTSGSAVQQWGCNVTALPQQWQFVLQSNGSYTLINRNSGKVLEVAGASRDDGTAVQQGDNNGGSHQQWQLVAQNEGFYQLVAQHSKACLEVTDGAITDGTPFRQMPCSAAAQQRFYLLPTTLGSQQVMEGSYTLQPLHSNKCIEAAGASLSSGANVNQNNCTPAGKSKQWQLVALSSDTYKLVNTNSGKVLEVTGGSTEDNAAVVQGDETGGNNQKWKLIGQGDGSYQLVAVHSNKCAEVTDASQADGANLRQAPCSIGAHQRYRLFPAALVAKSVYTFQALHSNKCLEVAGASLSTGGKVQQTTCDLTAPAQQWRLVALGNSYYKVLNRNSNKALEVPGGSTQDGVTLQQGDESTVAYQQWKLIAQRDGSYQLVAQHSNKCLEVAGAALTDGALLSQAPCSMGTQQRFKIIPVGEPTVTDFEDNTLDIFTNGYGSGLTNIARSGQKAATAVATGSTVAHRDLISSQVPVMVSAWVKGVGTAYLAFVGSDALEINHIARAVNNATWQQIVFAASAPAGAAYYDVVFHADNGALLLDNVMVMVNEKDTDGDGLSDRVESCRNPGTLNYEFYDGLMTSYSLANLPLSGALGKGVTTTFDPRALQKQFTPLDAYTYGVRYSGYLWITAEGAYTFTTTSYDGSQLLINNRVVVNNDGVHATTERSGTVYLYAGIHRFHLLYGAYTTLNNLTAVQWSGPAFSKTALPFTRLLSCDPNTDTDQDGIPNLRDLDSDDDTVPDAQENNR